MWCKPALDILHLFLLVRIASVWTAACRNENLEMDANQPGIECKTAGCAAAMQKYWIDLYLKPDGQPDQACTAARLATASLECFLQVFQNSFSEFESR